MRRRQHARYLALMALGVVLGPALLPGYIELFPMNVLNPEYGIWRAQLDFAGRAAEPEPEVLVLGDSRIHAAAVPRLLGARVRSIALGAATPIESYYLLRRYLDHHAPPRRVLLSFAPHHLEQAEGFWERTAKFKALRWTEYLEIFRRTEAHGDEVLGSGGFRQLAARWLRYRLNLVSVYAPELQNSRLVLRLGPNLRMRRQIDEDAGHRYYGKAESSSRTNQEARRLEFQPSALLESYLRDLLALAEARGIAVALVQMPMNRSSFEQLRPAYVEGYEAFMEALATDHPEVSFHAGIWALPDDHFGDRHHVNPRGARAVSARLARILRGS